MIRYIFLTIFFFSGFAALLYQTIWHRLLTLFGGADVYSVTIIVSAFMAGLGLGHLAGGHLADRLTARARLVAFALCELAIAGYALVSATIYYDMLYGQVGAWNLPRAALAMIVFLVTLWPTFVMGMSLPIAARVVSDNASESSAWVSRLYGWNTAGAACGSFLTVVVLFRSMDLRAGLRVGALMSVACGAAALLTWPALSRRLHQPGAATTIDDGGAHAGDAAAPASGLTVRSWIALYALSGFIALSLEIVWFRVLGVAIKSNAFTFGHLLAIYLGGISLGSLAANSRFARRFDATRAFCICQAAVPIWATVSASALVYAVDRLAVAGRLWEYFGSYETLSWQPGAPLFYTLWVIVPALLLGPSTICMGLSFGFLQRAVQTDVRVLGRRVGWLQAANIAGSLGGALLTGVLLLNWLGSPGTLRVLSIGAAVFLWQYARQSGGRRWMRAIAIGAPLLAAIIVPSAGLFWARLHGTNPHRIQHGEDASGLSLMSTAADGSTTVFVNGLGQSWLPYGRTHTALGALPALVHPRPERIAIVGLGSGDTAFGAGGRSETQVIDIIEIVAPQLDALGALNVRTPYPGLSRLLGDTRVRYFFTDGRTYLRKQTVAYDIIEADALRPTSAYAGNLYSVEYFTMLREHLRPGGLAVTWAPTPRVLNGLREVFPYVTSIGTVAIGSTSPIRLDEALLQTRMEQPFTRNYYASVGVDIADIIARQLLKETVSYGPGTVRVGLDVNHDLFPKDEFVARIQTPGR